MTRLPDASKVAAAESMNNKQLLTKGTDDNSCRISIPEATVRSNSILILGFSFSRFYLLERI